MRRLLAVLFIGLFGALACSDKPAQPGGGAPGGAGRGAAGPGAKGPMKFPVQVQTVAARDVEYSLDATGTVEAFEQVQVTARVQGVVEKVGFAEGTEVTKGQVLAEIEPERFKLGVAAAQAALEKAVAEHEEAAAAAERRESVQKQNPGLIPGEELESFRTRARSSLASTQSARVALDQAKLNLRDAYVRAPAAGTIETRTVQTGQFVQAGAVMATLVRREPLLVRFKIPEVDSPNLQVGMTVRFGTRERQEPMTARITHVAQGADPKTRMVEVTSEVTDERRATLRPGAFAEVSVPVRSVHAPVIPQSAVRPSERGFLAYVVDEGSIAHERVVQLGLRTSGGMVEVKDGLKEGERLVIRGAEALREGAEVRIAEELPAANGKPGSGKGGGGDAGTGTSTGAAP